MRSYIVFKRLLGGEWEAVKVGGKSAEYLHLEDALGMAETIKSSIIEVQVASVDTLVYYDDDGRRCVSKRYDLVC